jgi:type IV secretory pathway TrbD component
VSLIKDDLVLGCERLPVVAVIAVSIMCIMTLHTVLTIAFAIVLLFIAFPVLRYLAKRDPMFMRVMIRHFTYKSEYQAQASVGRRAPAPRQTI